MKVFLSSAVGLEEHGPCSEGNSGDGAPCLCTEISSGMCFDEHLEIASPIWGIQQPGGTAQGFGFIFLHFSYVLRGSSCP